MKVPFLKKYISINSTMTNVYYYHYALSNGMLVLDLIDTGRI